MKIKAILLAAAFSTITSSTYGETIASNVPKIIKTVTITGSLSGYGDMKDWVAFVLPISDLDMDEKALATKQRETNKFPISKDGQFKVILKNVLAGQYLFQDGKLNSDGSCDCSGGNITIDRETIELGDIERDL